MSRGAMSWVFTNSALTTLAGGASMISSRKIVSKLAALWLIAAVILVFSCTRVSAQALTFDASQGSAAIQEGSGSGTGSRTTGGVA